MSIKKTIAIFAVSLMACCAFTGCETSSDSSSSTADSSAAEESSTAEESSAEESVAEESSAEESVAEESSEEEAVAEESAEFSFEITSTSIGEDYSGKPILIVEYNFTNNSEEATSFSFACQDTAFQNGVECDSLVVSDAIDSQEQMNDIQPGTSYAVHVGYNLQDTTTPVDITITDFLGENTFVEETITL